MDGIVVNEVRVIKPVVAMLVRSDGALTLFGAIAVIVSFDTSNKNLLRDRREA